MRLKIQHKVVVTLCVYTTAKVSSAHHQLCCHTVLCGSNLTQRKAAQKWGKSSQDQLREKLLKVYKGRVCTSMVLSHTQIHTDTGQAFCTTKTQFEVVVNFSGDRETTEAGNSPSGFTDEGHRIKSNSPFYRITI